MKFGTRDAIGLGALGVGGLLTAKALTSGGGTPQGQVVDFDEGTKGLLQKQQERAQESAEDIVKRETAGADEKAMQFMQAQRESRPQQIASLGLGQMSTDLDQALANRAQRKYLDASGISKIRRKMEAQDKLLGAQAQAASAANARTKQKMDAYSTQLKNVAARKQARAQMLGSVLGLAGTIGGAVVAGPGGAAAGGAAGKAAAGGIS